MCWRSSRRAQQRRLVCIVMWTTTWSPPPLQTLTHPVEPSAGLAGEVLSMDVSDRKTSCPRYFLQLDLNPLKTFVLQRQQIMTGVRRSLMEFWRRRRLLRCPPAPPGPLFLGPSSLLFSISFQHLKTVRGPRGNVFNWCQKQSGCEWSSIEALQHWHKQVLSHAES